MRVDADRQLIISVAVPVQRVRATVGVLLLSTQPGEIDAIVATERWGVLRIALVAATVTIILSLLLRHHCRAAAAAAVGGRRRCRPRFRRAEIPDFSYRTDEVGI